MFFKNEFILSLKLFKWMIKLSKNATPHLLWVFKPTLRIVVDALQHCLAKARLAIFDKQV